MNRLINYATILLFLFAVLSCKGQKLSQPENKNTSNEVKKIVGGGCDGCELMFVDMPKRISSIDTSSAWNEKGQKIWITGKILNVDGKSPAKDVIIYYWHTDTKGYYSGGKGESERHGNIRGWVKSNELGEYAIYTVRPGNYPNSNMEAHIHLSVKEPTITEAYYTDDLVFDDDIKLTTEKRRSQKNRGGSGVLRPLMSGELQVAEHNIILGLNIPNYPTGYNRKIHSGLEIGEDNPSFTPFHAWGPDKGAKTCPVCKYGRFHGIMYFVGNKPNWNEIKEWLTFLENECDKRGKYLKVYFVYGNEIDFNPMERQIELENLGSELNIEKLALTFVPSFSDSVSDVDLNKINPAVENTFVIYRNRNIVEKFINIKPTEVNKSKVSSTLDQTRNCFFELEEPKHD